MVRSILLSLIAVLAASLPAQAQRSFEIPGIGTIYFGGGSDRRQTDQRLINERFEVLDTQRNYNDESRVVFDVGRKQGRFSQLRIRARGKVVRINQIEVIFGNGKSQTIDVYQAIYPGEVSSPIDLTGDTRRIRRVVLTKRRTWQRDRGDIELLGLADDTGDYKLVGKLGVRDRDPRVVFDNIDNGRGGFDSLKLRALGEPIRITTIEITFGNRKTQTVRYYKSLQPGYLSEAIDLAGQSRNIRSVVVNKRRDYNDGRGALQLFGLPGKARPKQRFTTLGTERTGRRSQDVVFDSLNQNRRWNRIRIVALDRPIEINDAVIVFGNGDRQRVNFRNARLRPGEATSIVDLDGRNARRIDRIRVGVNRDRGRRGRLQVQGVGDGFVAGPPPRPKPVVVPEGWVLFSSDRFGRRATTQTLKIGRDAGVFDRITFRALDNDINIRDLVIVYGNGKRDRRRMDIVVPAGYGTQPIKLAAGRGDSGRYIRELIVTARVATRNVRGTGLLQAYGEYADDWLQDRGPAADKGKWIRLGARKAAMFSKDTDGFPVGKRYGLFRAVKVRVLRKKVKVYGMTVTYGNGTTEAVPIYGKLSPGQWSQPFDLKGRKRYIQSVLLRYKTSFNFGGDGIVEVWGQR